MSPCPLFDAQTSSRSTPTSSGRCERTAFVPLSASSYLVNLIYSFSYLHHPDTEELSVLPSSVRGRMSQLLDTVCSMMSKYTPLELSILYRAYVEIGTVTRDLDRAVVKFVQKRYVFSLPSSAATRR